MKATLTRELIALIPALDNYAKRLCKDRDEAADLKGETLCRALEHLSQFDPSRNSLFRSYCFAIMYNLHCTQFNKGQTLERIKERLTWGMEASTDPTQYTDIDRKTIGAMMRAETKYFAIGYTYAEIAEFKGVPIGTIKSRIANNRTQIKRLLRAEQIAV